MARFFKRAPRRGMPISMTGLATGLRKMAYALENMSVYNGSVQWTAGGAPVIVFGTDGEGTIIEGDTIEGAGLPAGGEKYQVLQRDSNGQPAWDWVRYVVPEDD